jgi:hypothetical protein
MFGVESLGGLADAAVTVGIVLGEAMALYVGYGALARLVWPPVVDALRGE